MNELIIAAASFFLSVVGLWFAQNYRRQMSLKLSEIRLKAYSRLWEISGAAAPTRLDGWGDDGYLRLDERRKLWEAMTDWYYANGGGMLLTAKTKALYLNVKHNLICESSDLRPYGFAGRINMELGRPGNHELDDKVRGTLAIRLISLLRTQLKSDLAIYGPPYSDKLSEYEIFFLLNSKVNLRSKAWAKAARPYAQWLRLRRLRVPNSSTKEAQVSVRGLPEPSPLLEMPAALNVGEIARTPRSSNMALSSALNDSVGPAGAANILHGIPDHGDGCVSQHEA
jgi:hypothetical protein